MTRTLYGHPLSGNTHKVRMLLNSLDLPFREVTVDIPAGEHKQVEFLTLNPLGQAPVLVDEDGTTMRDSQAILIYLAKKYDGSAQWWPDDAGAQGRIAQWLSYTANEIQNSVSLARLHFLLGVPCDVAAVQARARACLAQVNAHLTEREWLETRRATIADIAVFPYLALAREGQVALDGLTHLLRWFERLRSLPRFVAMPGL